MKPVEFDASIDLCGDTPKTAVEKVRQSVKALPGAGWISVEYCGTLPGFARDMGEIPADRWLRVWPRGTSQAVEGAEWDSLRICIQNAVLKAIA